MKNNIQKYLTAGTIIFIFLAYSVQMFGQLVKVSVAPDSKTWNYKTGEIAKFDIRVTKNNILLDNVEVRYELSNDMMEPFKTGKVVLNDGKLIVDAGTLRKAGFLRCRIFAKYNDKDYEGRATIGFSPETLQPTAEMPLDFKEFWDNAISENAKIPLAPKLKIITDRCTDKVDVYELSFQNYKLYSRIYSILCVPKTGGKHPAMLRPPGAGVWKIGGDIQNAEKGYITLEIGIHGISLTLDNGVYDDLRNSALNDYQFFNWDNRDNVYYKRVYLGMIKAIDYLYSMPEFDGQNLIVQGGSQGGALTIVAAALDSRVKTAIAFYPALSDLTGYLHDRAGGWPHMFKNKTDNQKVLAEKVKSTGYYDVVNFARVLKTPIFVAFGYNDMVCPPTSSYSVYNIIKSDKTLLVVPEIEHFSYPEMWTEAWKWANDKCGLK